MAAPYPQIVLLGDSLMQLASQHQEGFSFQAALQSRFIRRFDVVNRGFGGWNTANMLEYLDRIIPMPSQNSPKIKYLALLLGANDACIPIETNAQHVPIDQYKENLIKIIRHPHVQAHQPKIFLVAPPPVDELKLYKNDTANGHARAVRESAISASYSEKAREVARENSDVTLIDLWKLIMDKAISMTPKDYTTGGPWLGSPENGNAGGLDVLLHDGIHMNGDAYQVFFDNFAPQIPETPASELVDFKDFVFPAWLALNPPARQPRS